MKHKTFNARHRLDIPGLAEAVAATPVDDKHKALVQRVRQFDALSECRLAVARDEGAYLAKRKVVRSDGTVIHVDHEQWLAQQLHAANGDAGAVRDRCKDTGLLRGTSRTLPRSRATIASLSREV